MHWKSIIAVGAICLFSSSIYAQDNIALNKEVFEIGGPFGIGVVEPGIPPFVVTDGNFLEPGAPWYLGSWWVDSICSDPPDSQAEPCALEIHLGGDFQVYSLIFQGDSDNYSLEYWDHGIPGWQPVWLVPVGTIEGISTRPEMTLVPPITTDRLRVLGVGGDGQYAVSEVQAFGEPFDPCVAGGGIPIGAGCWREEPEFETHVTAGEICYRFEFSCDGFVNGGFGGCVNPDGFFDFGMGAQIGDPHEHDPGEPGCGIGGGHMLNDKVEHNCSLDGQGKVQLEVKEVGMVHCDREE